MFMIRLAVRRRVTTLMVGLGLALLATLAVMRLPLELFPSIQAPALMINAGMPIASPEEIEENVARPLEDALASLRGVEEMNTRVHGGGVTINLSFEYGENMDYASSAARDAIDRVMRDLPDTVEHVPVRKFSSDDAPIMSYAVTAPPDDDDLARDIERECARRLNRVPGVAKIQLNGMRERRVGVTVSNELLNHHNMTIFHVIARLEQEDVIETAGKLDIGGTRYLVRCDNPLDSPAVVGEITLLTRGSEIIRLRDVAEVGWESPTPNVGARFDGQKVLGLEIYKETLAETIDVTWRIEAAMREIQSQFAPRDVTFHMMRNQGRGILEALDGLRINAMQGAAVAVVVLFFFLLRVGPTMIIAASIPFAIALTFTMMHHFGVSLNIVSISGLIVGMGLLVDNSIVVLESIESKWRPGVSASKAAIDGTSEVASAIFASTLTTIVVFLPITWVEHEIVEIFKDMALTVTFVLIASLVVALTVIPFLFSLRIGGGGPGNLAPAGYAVEDATRSPITPPKQSPSTVLLDWIRAAYRRLTPPLLKARWLTLSGLIALAVVAGWFARETSDLRGLPDLDLRIILLRLEMPPNAILNDTVEAAEFSGQRLVEACPEISHVYTESRRSNAFVLAILPLIGEKLISTKEATDIIRDNLPTIPGVEVQLMELTDPSSGGPDINIKLYSDETEALAEFADRVKQTMIADPRFESVESGVEDSMPEWMAMLSQPAMAQNRFRPDDVGFLLATLITGDQTRRLRIDGREVKLWVKGEDLSRSSEDLKNIRLRSRDGTRAYLRELAEFEKRAGQQMIRRLDRERVAVVSAAVREGEKIGESVQDLRAKVEALPRDPSIRIEESGGFEDAKEVFAQILMVMGLAFALVYMIMAAQFESLLQPFIISINIPLAWIAGALGLIALGTPFDTMAQIGLVVLTGIVVNDGILIIDKINRNRKNGLELRAAVLKAGQDKIRPVLMTSATTVGGLIPMSLPDPDATINWAPLARLISGGLIAATLFTLVVVPLLYYIVQDFGVARIWVWSHLRKMAGRHARGETLSKSS